MQASVDGGFKIVEFTLTTPGCLDAVANFRAKHGSNVMVGCGTIMDIEDAQNALDAGSEFIVAPVLVPEVEAPTRTRQVNEIPDVSEKTASLTCRSAPPCRRS
jgi:2-dehydro-3-deoxyphosphogluconate aldolase/(4S)-4-hydroxy-2-oxoglutarate aldolase